MDKILVVDDSILNLTVLSRILEPNYDVITVQNGLDALQMAVAIKPSLILLDLIMRGMDGFEVLEKLKSNPSTHDIPVIIITGLQGGNHEERVLQFGAVDFITKPFSPGIVLARVHTHVELYRYRKNAEHMAMVDSLTEIPNRRSFDKELSDLWSVAQKEGLLFSLALSDIDFFKGYNDNYGHLAGDDIIRLVARVLHQTVLPLGGFAARCGGEEYACLLPRLPADSAELVAHSIRRNVESLSLPHSVSTVSPYVTLSIGGATVNPGSGITQEAMLKTADLMLYEAKERGRNCVVWTEL